MSYIVIQRRTHNCVGLIHQCEAPVSDYFKLSSPQNARVRDTKQRSLFQRTVQELSRRSRVKIDDLYILYQQELLSFEPKADFELDEGQEVELNFLISLLRAGQSPEWIKQAVSNLTFPYRYDANRMIYDMQQRRWLCRQIVDVSELTVEGRINAAREDKDVRALRDIAQEALKALVSVTESAIATDES